MGIPDVFLGLPVVHSLFHHGNKECYMKKIFGLVRGDIKNIVRDPTLLFVTVLPLLLGLTARFFVPWLANLLQPRFDLTPYYVHIMGILAVYPPAAFGWVIGFTLLDERDENILTAISVTPLSKTGYITYRLTMPVIMGCILCYITLLIAGLVPLSPVALLPVTLVSALGAPIAALFMVAFAGNKVEGLALSKAISLMYIGPLAVIFIQSNWQYLAGIMPTFWVSRAFVSGYSNMGEYWLAITGGVIVSCIFLGLFLKRFNARAD
jgi:fluoroquinolone transport system permease protein